MYNIAKASEQDRRVPFRNTAQQTGLHEAIIEKDFWVCLTLDHLFHHSGNVKKCAVGKHPKSEKLGSTGQAACCARIHSRYFTGGSPSGLRV